jgi:DmsE family decaheme c-type cytochrome
MKLKSALWAVALCLFGLWGPAWAAKDADASAKCMKCHEDEDYAKMARSAHAVSSDPRAPTCVSCHGTSSAHADHPRGGGKRPGADRSFKGGAAMPPEAASAVCLTCHDRDPKQRMWHGSQHPTADVGCNNCHQVHVNKDPVLSKQTQPAVCYTCHKEQRVQVQRVSRHPIPEAKMTCSDCHNVHGSVGPKLAKRDSTNDTCFTCHAEKRGPFVYSHQPVTEDCAQCHNPHGSNVPAMLTARAPMLCQQCHTPHVSGDVGALGGQPGVFPPPVPGQSSPAVPPGSSAKNVVNMWQGRSCMGCHTQVHGSNNPATTVPTPQRLFR